MFYKQNKKLVTWFMVALAAGIVLIDGFINNPIARGLTLLLFVLIMIVFFISTINKDMERVSLECDLEKQNQLKSIDLVRAKLETLITYLPFPMVLINQDGEIELSNDSFTLLMNESNDQLKSINSKGIPFMIKRVLNDIYLNEESLTTNISLNAMDYQCVSIPIIQSRRYKGSLVVFSDITKLLYQERVQKRFVADASHELKTPITAIKGMIEILTREDFNDEKTEKEFLDQIKHETERLELIVKDLLYLSKLSNQTILLNKQPLDVKAIVSEAIKTLKLKLADKNIRVNIQELDKEPLLADSTSLLTVFSNLIDNVCSYSNASQLDIIIDGNQKNKIITLKDNGIGISAEDITQIFDRFYRVDDDRNRNTGGSGLGLSIVKELIGVHNGNVEVQSVVNEYTQFVITLPKLTKS